MRASTTGVTASQRGQSGWLTAELLLCVAGKKSIAIDLKTDPMAGRIMKRLIESADVFITNMREVALTRMTFDMEDGTSFNLGYESMCSVNPRIVYGATNGFGPVGPLAEKKMFDGAAQSKGGIVSVTGHSDGPPIMPGATIGDTAGAMQLALGVMSALLARERFGVGQKVNTSSYGAQLLLQRWELTQTALTGHEMTRDDGFHPNIP